MFNKEKAEMMRDVREFILSRQPMHRQGTADDLANAALFLASDLSSYITRTLLPVDGGMQAAGSPASSSGFEHMRSRLNAG
jgi:NAD(P)-dependent dehydrogenase (short-subunit alcohol dehydrogenase family)